MNIDYLLILVEPTKKLISDKTPDTLCKSKYFYEVFLIVKYHMIPNLGKGGNNLWLSDGFCDDANNIEECNYDGGDCCGINVQKNFCVNCTCTGKCKLVIHMSLSFLFLDILTNR